MVHRSQNRSGDITVTTTGDATNAVAGNVMSWGTGLLSAVVLSFVFPGKDESSDEGAVVRANKINSTAPPRREAGSLAEPACIGKRACEWRGSGV